MGESKRIVKTWLGVIEVAVGLFVVAYGVWIAADAFSQPPDHVSPVWGYAFALSYVFVGVVALVVPGVLLMRGVAQAWYFQLLIPAGLMVREQLAVLMVLVLRAAGLV